MKKEIEMLKNISLLSREDGASRNLADLCSGDM